MPFKASRDAGQHCVYGSKNTAYMTTVLANTIANYPIASLGPGEIWGLF